MKRVVLFCGKQGSGKTTSAKRLQAELWSIGLKAAKFRFADAVYQAHDAVRGVMRRFGIEPSSAPDGRLLQLLGTEWGRKVLGQDVWVATLMASVLDYWAVNQDGIVVVDDCRFENEFKIFAGDPNVLVTRIRLVAPRDIRKGRAEKWRDDEGHESETALDGYGDNWFDCVADTSKTSPSEIAGRIIEQIKNQQGRPQVTA